MSHNPALQTNPVPAGLPLAHSGNGAISRNSDLNQQGKQIQELVEQVGAYADPAARALLNECLEALLTLHGQGLARIMEVIKDAGPDGQKVLDQVSHDQVVRGLLLIHGLHPLDLETRLGQALNQVRPYMESHNGNVELISLANDVATLRLQGACRTCPSSTVTMELTLRRAIEEFCPDLLGLEVEDMPEPSHAGGAKAP